jgi:predicted DNA-binding WGR domain protein
MKLVILHDLDGEEVLVNVGRINAGIRRYPDENAAVQEPFTKLFYAQRDKGMESLGFPDSVKETPKEIVELARK